MKGLLKVVTLIDTTAGGGRNCIDETFISFGIVCFGKFARSFNYESLGAEAEAVVSMWLKGGVISVILRAAIDLDETRADSVYIAWNAFALKLLCLSIGGSKYLKRAYRRLGKWWWCLVFNV